MLDILAIFNAKWFQWEWGLVKGEIRWPLVLEI